jgi:hypothetical protein
VVRQDRVLRTASASIARKHAEAAIATLALIMKDKGEPGAVRARAANDLLDRGYGRPPHAPIEVPTPPSEVPEFPTVEEIDAELRRRGLLTVRELVAQERAREAAIAAARPKAPTSVEPQGGAAPRNQHYDRSSAK